MPPVNASVQGGLLDIAIHPDFVTNRLIYLSHTKASANGAQWTDTVVRGRFDSERLTIVEEIFEAQAWSRQPTIAVERAGWRSTARVFSTSPSETAPQPDPKIGLPMSPKISPIIWARPFGSTTWSYGHRNAQGMAFHPGTGDLWQSEHGAQGGDELNVIRPGLNYGWPVIGYGAHYGAPRRVPPLHEGTHRDGMEQPIHHLTPSISPSGIMIYAGGRFPDWRGNIFVAALAGEKLVRIIVGWAAVCQ